MWLWPSERVVLDSTCSPAVVFGRIAARTDPRGVLDPRPASGERPYEGQVEGAVFRVRPSWPGHRHSFRVYIEGEVEPRAGGSRVHATLYLDRGTVAFAVALALVVSLAAVLRPLVRGGEGPSRVFWLLYGVAVGLAWLGLMAAWWAGLNGARRFLAEVAADAGAGDSEVTGGGPGASTPPSPP